MTNTKLMTITEAERLQACEAVIERGLHTFVQVGTALLEIRDSRLYRDSHSTFEDYCRARWAMSRPRAYQLIEAAEVVGHLSTIVDKTPETESQARPLTALEPDEQVAVWTKAVETAPNGKLTAAHVQSVVNEIVKPHVAHNSGNNEWYTPPEYIDAARRVMSDIDLDPASTLIANRIVKAKKIYTAQDDGLTKKWRGRVWMNPPYAGEWIGAFSEKLIEHYLAGDVSEAMALVNNATETVWFQGMLEHASAVCFIRGRVRFLDADGNPGAPLQGQAVLYFGDNGEGFAEHFSGFGIVLHG